MSCNTPVRAVPALLLATFLAFPLFGGVSRAGASAGLPAPDYATLAAWAAYPGQPSHAEDVPTGVAPALHPTVPVFFVHPTTDLAPVTGNAAFDAGGGVGERVDGAVLRFQASVFNDCCRIYAPRYRQASLKAVTGNTAAAYAADEQAYGDVARAFDRFLQLNPDGPFVLASHSQGSIHALRLLQQRILGTPLQGRLVVAYLIGVALPAQIEALGIPICDSAQATGCVVSWNSVRRGSDDRRRRESAVIWWQGSYQPIAGRPLACVNPLNWRRDGEADPGANLGAVYSEGRDAALPAPLPGLTGAWCEDGLLGVDVPWGERRHFSDALTLAGIYHDFDYALFYMNLRRNASARVRAWYDQRH